MKPRTDTCTNDHAAFDGAFQATNVWGPEPSQPLTPNIILIRIMDWYYGSGVNDYLVPKDQDLLDRHPSPDYWSNWEISATEGFNSPKNFFIMDFFEERFNNQIELEPSLHDKDQSSSSSVCGGLPEQSFQQTALSCDQPNYQLQDLPRFEPMNDTFLDPVPEDMPCVDDENLDKSISISTENQCSSTPGNLRKAITASKSVSSISESKDFLDTEALQAKVSRDDGMHEQSSPEESILKDLEMVIGQFTEGTRICFRDALYRLARNTEQQHAMVDQDEDLNIQKPIPHTDHDETMRSQDKKPMESATNNIDRIIANLMFKSIEFNIHDPPLASSINSMQQVIESNDLHGNNSKALNIGEKSCNSHPQKLPAHAVIPRFGLSNQPRDTGSYIACEDPTNKSFMIGFAVSIQLNFAWNVSD
ncbi:Protein LNK3, partial [Mucuna pruriens]